MNNRKRHSVKTKRLPLPIGNSDWAVVKGGYWSADKTQLISGLLDKKTTVALFTRPRRFGKTVALEMSHTFFEQTEKSNASLFKGTKVWKDAAHRAEQGRYPVIHVTLKDAKGGDWDSVCSRIAYALRMEFDRHRAVFESKKTAEYARSFYAAIIDRTKVPDDLDTSLGILAAALHVHYGEKPMILIDEYDSPINWAATRGFGEEV